jgi:hypothetical protein
MRSGRGGKGKSEKKGNGNRKKGKGAARGAETQRGSWERGGEEKVVRGRW